MKINLDNSNYKKVLEINGNDFVVDFSKDETVAELMRIRKFAEGKTVIECKDDFIKSLKLLLGDDCIKKIYGADIPQAVTVRDCIDFICAQYDAIIFEKEKKKAEPYLQEIEKLSKYANAVPRRNV